MTPAEIKKVLSQVLTELPVTALREAQQQREVMTPLFLKALEDVQIKDGRSSSASKSRFAIHALYILTEWREMQAWPLVIDLFSSMSAQDNISIGDVFDEVVCDSLSQIFASLCPKPSLSQKPSPDDFRPLKSIIENTSIDEYVRDAALSALVVCYQQGDLALQELKDYLHQLYKFGLEQEKNQIWNAWVQACYNSEPDEFMDALRDLYENELADPYYITLDELQERCGKDAKMIRKLVHHQEGDFYRYITDALAGLRTLSCYSGEANELLKSMENMVINQTQPVSQPVSSQAIPMNSGMADYSNIGRNDPCPCGSGKKFKKCCLH